MEILEPIPEQEHRVEIVTPGQIITQDPQFMRGHGTYLKDQTLIASVAGQIDKVSKLISVKALKAKYSGDIGDVVVGRIVEKRWKVDIKSKQDAILLLSSINLPGGVQRRKLDSDALEMRTFFDVGDAEVHQFFVDGSASLHTRSTKYRKLKNGTLVSVPALLVKRSKSHFITLSCGVEVILGLNGYIWVSKHVPISSELENQMEGIYAIENDPISREDRECIARVANIIKSLAALHYPIHESIIAYAYETSLAYHCKDILNRDIQKMIIEQSAEQVEQAMRE